MTRFPSRKAEGYEDVVGEIKRLASNVTIVANPEPVTEHIGPHSGEIRSQLFMGAGIETARA